MLHDMAQHLILNCLNASWWNTILTHLTSHNWPTQFIKQHPYFKGLITKPIDQIQINAYTLETFKEWFDKYQMHLEKYQLCTSDIYNIDKTEFILGDEEKRYVIVDRRLAIELTAKMKKGEFLTVIEYVSAVGISIAPMIIYKSQHLQSH